MKSDMMDVDPKKVTTYLGIGFGIFFGIILLFASTYIIDPGHRGVIVTMGKVSPNFAPEGFGIKSPFVTTVIPSIWLIWVSRKRNPG